MDWMRRALAPIVTLLVLAAPSAAHAATRYASPNGSTTSPQCAQSDPCRIDRAVNGAAPDDEVVVASGTYSVTVALKPTGRIDLHGDPDHGWPRIIASSSLKSSLLTFTAGTLSHVSLESAATDKAALVLTGGVADGVRLWASVADGGDVVASAAGTVLRNSVVRTDGPKGDTAGLDLTDRGIDGSIELRNVTVMATAGSATGISCDMKSATAALVNTLVRGPGRDIDAHGACTAAFSNFRPAFSSGLAPGTGNQSAEPVFADGDYRPAAGSPTIDAGALDAFAGSPDPDGRPRALGAAPDIGAYEYAPAATGEAGAPSAQLPDDLQGVPLPEQGVNVIVAPARGTVRVRRPGASSFTVLDKAGRIPVGSVIDARRGRVRLASAIDDGRVQVGLFWGSAFKTSQRRTGSGMTTLTLRGSLPRCRAIRAQSALAFSAKKRKRHRSLWARDNGGRFRTHGNDSVATARGTAWLTRDTCRGTLTRVSDGSVSVRDLRRHRRVLVTAGHAYLARSRR
jgi:hypothetical protein